MLGQATTAVLDTVTIVGIFLCLTKGADLMLRPHQEKAVKDHLEAFLLWLSYINPLGYYRRVVDRSILSFIGFIVVAIVGPLYRVIVLHFMTLKTQTDALAFFTGVLAFFMSLRFVRKHHRFMISATTGAYAAEHQQPFGLRQFLVISLEVTMLLFAVSVFTMGIVLTLPSLLIEHKLAFSKEHFGYATIAVAPVLFIVAEFGGSAIIVLLACLALAIAQVITKALAGILWRVVEYGKGPVAAATVLLTVALGLLDLYFRTGGKTK